MRSERQCDENFKGVLVCIAQVLILALALIYLR
jgi:hypothetical protein